MLCELHTRHRFYCLVDRLLNTFHWNVFFFWSWTYAFKCECNGREREREIDEETVFVQNLLNINLWLVYSVDVCRSRFLPTNEMEFFMFERQPTNFLNLRLTDCDYLIFSSGTIDLFGFVDSSKKTENDRFVKQQNLKWLKWIFMQSTDGNYGNKVVN